MKLAIRLPIRLLAVTAVVLLAGLGSVTPTLAQTGDDLELQGIDTTGFPLVRAVVSGPTLEGDDLDSAFVVVEEGAEVPVDVVRLRSDDLNLVIALDTSSSMQGEPIAQAKAAVASMLETLPATVPVSVVSFGGTTAVQSPFTIDRAATVASVDRLIAAGGTRLFDGVEQSLFQLDSQGGTGALVVLADGDDTESTVTFSEAADALASSSARVSFVALETESFSADNLEALADAGDGAVVSVGQAGDLVGAFEQVASSLATTYELRWRSGVTSETGEVEISLAGSSGGVTGSFAHDGPGEFVPQIATDTRTVGAGGPFSASWVPFVAAVAVSGGALVLFMGFRNSDGATERREERQQERDARKEERARGKSGMQERLEGLSAQMLEANNRGRSLDDRLDQAGLAVRANEFVVACAAIVVASLLVGVLLFGVPFFVLGALFPIIGIPLTLKILTGRRRKAFITQLGDTIQLMTGSLTAGYGLGQTIDSVAREAESPTSEEFARVVMETRLGRSLEDALDAMSLRIQAPDFDWVVDAIKIQSSVGGDLAEILEQVGETIRARTRIKRQVDALTAEGKISALVLFCLPFGLGFFIFSSNPSYIEPLYTTGVGYVMMGAIAFMLTVGGLWLRKLVNPEF